jgi:hypothetical protein
MAILLGDLREAFKKLNQMEEAAQTFDKQINLSDRMSTDKMLGMGMPDTSGMLGLNAGQALADALQKGLFPDIPNAADALLGSLPGFAEMFAETERRRQEALDFYRPQAYDRITPADIDHAIPRIDWAAFMAAQRPSLTETEEAATHPRQAPVIEERTQLAAALDSRRKERGIQERAATELLAYAWATWGGYEEGDGIPEMMAHFLPTDADWASLSDTELEPEYLRKILATPEERAMLPNIGMQWNADGQGFIPAYGVHRVVGQGLGRFPEWKTKSGNTPEHAISKYGVRGHLSISGNSALTIWEGVKEKAKQAKQYGDILPDVYLVVVATILANREKLDLFGNGHSYIALDSAMADLGIRKHERKYGHEDIEKVRHAIQAIGDITIRGVRTAYLKGAKPIDVPFEGPLWRVMDTVPKVRTTRELEAFLAGERGDFTNDAGTIPAQAIAGFSLALGAGLHIGHDEMPHEARTMRKIMSYSPVHGRFKRRLGYSLSCEFRLRYQQQNWAQPYKVRDVLEDAPIPIDTSNPRRTYNLFHEALIALWKDQVIGTVRYPKAPSGKQRLIENGTQCDPGYNTGKKGWLDEWLEAQIVIMPPADVEAAYREALGDGRQRKKKGQRPILKSAG